MDINLEKDHYEELAFKISERVSLVIEEEDVYLEIDFAYFPIENLFMSYEGLESNQITNGYEIETLTIEELKLISEVVKKQNIF